MIKHDGTRIPVSPPRFDADGSEWVAVTWADQVALFGSIQSSTWEVTTGWTVEEQRQDVTVTDESGTSYDHTNEARLTVTAGTTSGTITNRVVFADATTLDRSVTLFVADT